MTEQIGEQGPVDPLYVETMNRVAQQIDAALNGDAKGEDRTIAFALVMAKFGDIQDGRVNYISNGEREDIVKMMKEVIVRFEAQASEVN